MQRINKDESGFSVVEVILVVVIVALIGVVGWLVYKDHHKTTTASTANNTSSNQPATTTKTTSTTSTSTKTTSTNPYAGWNTYTASDNTYTVNYPSNWVSDPCITNNTCSTTAEVDNYLSPASNPSWQVIELNHNKTSDSAKAWFDAYKNVPSAYSCVYDNSALTINGYSAYFAEYFITPNANQCPSAPTTGSTTSGATTTTGYSDYYTIVNNGQAVIISMPVQDGSNGSRDTVPLVSTFNEIAKSIKFNN